LGALVGARRDEVGQYIAVEAATGQLRGPCGGHHPRRQLRLRRNHRPRSCEARQHREIFGVSVLNEHIAALEDGHLHRRCQGLVEHPFGCENGQVRSRGRGVARIARALRVDDVQQRVGIKLFAHRLRARGRLAAARAQPRKQRHGPDRKSRGEAEAHASYTTAMARKIVEQRLLEVSSRTKRVREELRVAEEQLAHFAHEAEDARIRSLVSETPLAEQEHREAARHAAAMRRHHDELVAELQRLDALQDGLLDQLSVES
jgi:hypothetical protein